MTYTEQDVERVAEAIYSVEPDYHVTMGGTILKSFQEARGDYKSRARKLARAALAAMQPTSLHPDDLAADAFARHMKAKLAKKRSEGRGGWEDRDHCSTAFLSQLLRDHVEKGDPLDVGNIAMMLHIRGDRIEAMQPTEPLEEGDRA